MAIVSSMIILPRKGMLDWQFRASVFPKSVAHLSFCLTDVLCMAFGALDHIDDVSGCVADAMS